MNHLSVASATTRAHPAAITFLGVATAPALVSPCPVLPHPGSFLPAAKVSLLKCNSGQVISDGNSSVGPISCAMKPSVHVLACKTLPNLAPHYTRTHHVPLSLCCSPSSSLVLLGQLEPCSNLRAFVPAVPADWNALFYTFPWLAPSHPSRADIASSEKRILTTLNYFSTKSLTLFYCFHDKSHNAKLLCVFVSQLDCQLPGSWSLLAHFLHPGRDTWHTVGTQYISVKR